MLPPASAVGASSPAWRAPARTQPMSAWAHPSPGDRACGTYQRSRLAAGGCLPAGRGCHRPVAGQVGSAGGTGTNTPSRRPCSHSSRVIRREVISPPMWEASRMRVHDSVPGRGRSTRTQYTAPSGSSARTYVVGISGFPCNKAVGDGLCSSRGGTCRPRQPLGSRPH